MKIEKYTNLSFWLNIFKHLAFLAAVLGLLGYFLVGGWLPYIAAPLSILFGTILTLKHKNKKDFMSGVSCIIAGVITLLFLLSWIIEGKLSEKIPFVLRFSIGVAPLLLLLFGLIFSHKYRKSLKNLSK